MSCCVASVLSWEHEAELMTVHFSQITAVVSNERSCVTCYQQNIAGHITLCAEALTVYPQCMCNSGDYEHIVFVLIICIPLFIFICMYLLYIHLA